MTIKATIIADSIHNDTRITTFELEYPRFIHSEFMTHRMFSRNAASSRAIPVTKMHDTINNDPAMPVYWGKNRPGMSAEGEVDDVMAAKEVWQNAKNAAINYATDLSALGSHKQITNRITEPYQNIKTVMTATEFKNWFELRYHEDAQPEIKVLAGKMFGQMQLSTPQELWPGQWHVPYVATIIVEGKMQYWLDESTEITRDEAIKVSASCCAQVSYRNNDTSLKKAEMIYDRLITSVPMHASPIEHQATPLSMPFHRSLLRQKWDLGMTHVDRKGDCWSGNFKNWAQYRQILSQST